MNTWSVGLNFFVAGLLLGMAACGRGSWLGGFLGAVNLGFGIMRLSTLGAR
jgi:hypothetical protein